MSPQVCSLMAAVVCLGAFIAAWAHTGCMLRLTFCDANTISNHYMCDILPSWSSAPALTSMYWWFSSSLALMLVCLASPSLLHMFFILSSILHISSTEGRSKAFSTCSSHIIVVFYFLWVRGIYVSSSFFCFVHE